MVCSFCGMTGHNISNCESQIVARARCIFENDYDPIFHSDDSLNRNYWWKRIIIKNIDEFSESWWYENQVTRTVLPIVKVSSYGTMECYEHIVYAIDSNLPLHNEWFERIEQFRSGALTGSTTSIEVVSLNDCRWKALPNAWFSRNHNARLNCCFKNQEDTMQARGRVLSLLKHLHEERHPHDPIPQYIDRVDHESVDSDDASHDDTVVSPNGGNIIHIDASEQSRNPGEMPDLRRPDLQIEPPSDTQPTNVTISDTTTCGICWDELGEANVMVTKCGHKFCCDCILSHFQNAAGTNCPLCREEYAKRVPGWIPPEEVDDRPRRRRGRPRRQRDYYEPENPVTPERPTLDNAIIHEIPDMPPLNLLNDFNNNLNDINNINNDNNNNINSNNNNINNNVINNNNNENIVHEQALILGNAILNAISRINNSR